MDGQPTDIVQMLTRRPRLSCLSVGQARIVTAMRVTVLAQAQNVDVRAFLIQRMGSESAGRHFAHLIETMRECWPEPVCVHRPCCGQLSYDEMCLLDLMTAGLMGQDGIFHDLIRDMVGERDRERFLSMVKRFGGACEEGFASVG